jgi:galactokinase
VPAVDEVVVRAPGRVNLIGDHTDYNDGFVLPLAIDAATTLRGRARPDRRVEVHSAQLGRGRVDLDDPVRCGAFTDYLAGVAAAWEQATGRRLVGMDASLDSTVPVGAGLSSSAALELAAIRALVALSGHDWDPVTAALAAQRGERDVVGANVGIMDQLTVATARAGSALLVDCRTLDVVAHVLPPEATVVVLDTGTRRQLVGSAYNERRSECDAAAVALGVPAPRDATAAGVEALADGRLRRRARHVVSENARVQQAAAALDRGDAAEVGRLMVASHRSLADDYEVSGPELDAMVEAALAAPGCWGARLTGAGFAGCGVALVERAAVAPFLDAVRSGYLDETGIEPVLLVTGAAAGVHLVEG